MDGLFVPSELLLEIKYLNEEVFFFSFSPGILSILTSLIYHHTVAT